MQLFGLLKSYNYREIYWRGHALEERSDTRCRADCYGDRMNSESVGNGDGL